MLINGGDSVVMIMVMVVCLATLDNEGWFYGTSHNTGMSGLYPGNYVEKTKDSDCWTLHRYI